MVLCLCVSVYRDNDIMSCVCLFVCLRVCVYTDNYMMSCVCLFVCLRVCVCTDNYMMSCVSFVCVSLCTEIMIQCHVVLCLCVSVSMYTQIII